MIQASANLETLKKALIDEVQKALGFSPAGWIHKLIEPWIERPCLKFAEIGSKFDALVASYGFTEAARQILPHFVNSVQAKGIENIPNSGPLLITSNHPGTYDSLVIASNVPRDDLKIIAGNIPFLRNLPATQNYMIHTTLDTHDRMTVLRKAIRHLKSGGSVLIFGTGGIDPEPASMPGVEAEIEKWSPSIELLLRKVPQAKAMATIVSGVLSPKFLQHPFTFFRSERRDKQRISEMMQVISQMLSPGQLSLIPRVSFATPLSTDEALSTGNPSILSALVERGKQLLGDHLSWSQSVGI